VVRENVPRVEAWLRGHGDRFSWIPPDAGAILYTRYAHPINSTALVTRLREEESVLVVPGDQFGMDGYLRLGVGERVDYLMEGLARVRAVLDRLPQGAGAPP
jgi:aspartate/methionine/tyrosine aminotransferase